MGPAFKVVRIGIKQRLAHKKYKKSDAKTIARKIKKIQDKPDKVVRIGIKQRLAHKKYKKKADAKAIARKIKKINNQDPLLLLIPRHAPYRGPQERDHALMQFIQDGDKIIRKYVGVNESFHYGPHLLDSFPCKDPSFYLQ